MRPLTNLAGLALASQQASALRGTSAENLISYSAACYSGFGVSPATNRVAGVGLVGRAFVGILYIKFGPILCELFCC
jgi:hypothetical protein